MDHWPLFRELCERTIGFHALQVFKALNIILDGLEIGHHSAQPALGDKKLTAPDRLLTDHVLGLFLGSHEEHRMPAADDLIDFLAGLLHGKHGLFEIDDIDSAFGGKNKAFHLGIPATSLVTEMNARFKKILDSDI